MYKPSLHNKIKFNKLSYVLAEITNCHTKNMLYVFEVNISQCPTEFSLDTSNGIIYVHMILSLKKS